MVFYGGYLPPDWILGNPLSKKRATSPNIEYPIGNHERKPRLF